METGRGYAPTRGADVAGRMICVGATLEHTGALTGIKTLVTVSEIRIGGKDRKQYIVLEDQNGGQWRAACSDWDDAPFADFRLIDNGTRNKKYFAREMK